MQQVLCAAQPGAAIRAPNWDPKSCSWAGTAAATPRGAELCRPNGKSRAVCGSISMSVDALWAMPLILELAPDFSSFFRCLQQVFGFNSPCSLIHLGRQLGLHHAELRLSPSAASTHHLQGSSIPCFLYGPTHAGVSGTEHF